MAPKTEETPTAPQVVGLTKDDLKEILAAVMAAKGSGDASPELSLALASLNKLTEEVGRTVTRGNAIGHDSGLSVFTSEPSCEICAVGGDHPGAERRKKAHPKEALKYRTLFCGAPLDGSQLTPLEVKLINALANGDHPRDARGGYGDEGADGGWSVRFSGQGLSRRMEIYVPFNGFDRRNDLPGLSQICTELLHGPKAADPLLNIALLQKMQEQIEELKATRVGA